MRKLFASLMVSVATIGSVFGCWFTSENWQDNYIYSVNNTAIHFDPAGQTYDNALFYNNQSVALPITVQVKIAPRDGQTRVATAILQYKVVRTNGNTSGWVTVKTIDNPVWSMNFTVPVNLFGRSGMIDVDSANISAGDTIIIRVWISDNIYANGDLNEDIQASWIQTTMPNMQLDGGMSSWHPSHVMTVKYNGQRRIIL